MLSDKRIKEYVSQYGLIDPFDLENLNPNSYDLTLDYVTSREGITINRDYIEPGEFMLAASREMVEVPNTIVGIVKNKSSHARKGLDVVLNAGLIDSGYKGNITFALHNTSQSRVYLNPGMRIAQICFFSVDGMVEKPYAGHYQGQEGVGVSAY